MKHFVTALTLSVLTVSACVPVSTREGEGEARPDRVFPHRMPEKKPDMELSAAMDRLFDYLAPRAQDNELFSQFKYTRIDGFDYRDGDGTVSEDEQRLLVIAKRGEAEPQPQPTIRVTQPREPAPVPVAPAPPSVPPIAVSGDATAVSFVSSAGSFSASNAPVGTYRIMATFPGQDATCANAASCLDLLQRGLSTGDGVYTIDPDGEAGEAPFEVVCDMTADGGGWTLVMVGDEATSGGTPIVPVATIRPWPFISRGTLITVPKPPGLVSVTFVPWKSAASSFPSRPRATRSS